MISHGRSFDRIFRCNQFMEVLSEYQQIAALPSDKYSFASYREPGSDLGIFRRMKLALTSRIAWIRGLWTWEDG